MLNADKIVVLDTQKIERILKYGIGRSGLPDENDVITFALRELLLYMGTGSVSEFQLTKRIAEEKHENHKIKPKFHYNLSDTTSVWECECGNSFKTTHEPGILRGTKVYFCSRCGKAFDWTSEEE